MHFMHIDTLLRHIQDYSGIFSILCNPHIFTILPMLSPSIYRAGGETLRNVDQAYSESSHIQAYSEPCATLAYSETWHTRNTGIFSTLP